MKHQTHPQRALASNGLGACHGQRDQAGLPLSGGYFFNPFSNSKNPAHANLAPAERDQIPWFHFCTRQTA